jgi:hypothetical protein
MEKLYNRSKSQLEQEEERTRRVNALATHTRTWRQPQAFAYRLKRGRDGQTETCMDQVVLPWNPDNGVDVETPLTAEQLSEVAAGKQLRRSAEMLAANFRKLDRNAGSARYALEHELYLNAYGRADHNKCNDATVARCERCFSPAHLNVEDCDVRSFAQPPIQPHKRGDITRRATDGQLFDAQEPLCDMCHMRGHRSRDCRSCQRCGRWGHISDWCGSGFIGRHGP